jgi:molecular chaperone DnaK
VAFEASITRDELAALVEPLVERTMAVCRETLAAKGLAPGDIDEVILVGGQSRMPLVHERVQALFGKAPSRSVHPDEAVALGAAILADSLACPSGVVLIDVLPMSIGIALPDGRVRQVFERNTPLPSRKQYGLSTTEDGQTEFELVLVQGEGQTASDCEYLGTVRLDGLPAGPRGMVKIAVGLDLGAECLLTVTAREPNTSRAVKTSFTARGARAQPAPRGPARDAVTGLVTTTHRLPLPPTELPAPPAPAPAGPPAPESAPRAVRPRSLLSRLIGRREA